MADGTQALPAPRRDGAGSYHIHIYGHVSPYWEAELSMRLTYLQTDAGIISTLTGDLPDQSALLNTLGRLMMWGYLILAVRYEVAATDGAPAGEPRV